MSFSKSAPRWCSLASRTLGWRPEEFWSATPSELSTALRDPGGTEADTAPTRDLIQQLMERDAHGR
ncbi:MAG: phage tail assembly chaperone [Erythrobacter sp.]|uniref:phage tail assembly chaperone n=1 Tax=Erythrobacter sp. TaxID=1042 RepID=UPI00262F920C|nr:phage tail assembly chaperone [Erythrobacter sp.]MDJ0979501.1 phage tail assembly chaperone [Erythrobacter sp.]